MDLSRRQTPAEGPGNHRAPIFLGGLWLRLVTLAGSQAMSEAVHLHYPLVLSREKDPHPLRLTSELTRVGSERLACLQAPGVCVGARLGKTAL